MIVNGKNHKDYFVQQLKVDATYKNKSRLELLIPLVSGKKVLHIGFVDWPISNPNKSLHKQLSPHCTLLDGFDVNTEGAEELRVENGNLFFNMSQLIDQYDIILCPEVLEHVDNVQLFLSGLDKFSGSLIISAPDAYLLQNHFEENSDFLEVVHPDHNCYYTPYTLKNTIEKYSKRKVKYLHWVDSISILAVCS